MKTRKKLLLVVAIAIICIVVASLIIIRNGSMLSLSSQCQTAVADGFLLSRENGFTYVCGNTTVNDGRLAISVHNYRFALARNISFVPGPNELYPAPEDVFAIANITFSNIGDGNTTVGGGFFTQMGTSGFSPVQNTNWSMNATFPGQYPYRSLPEIKGGVYLPPGHAIDTFLLFFVPRATQSNITALSLQFLWYRELAYGGNYLGGGEFDCRTGNCQNPLSELIVAISPSK